jgi:hypothetical protein
MSRIVMVITELLEIARRGARREPAATADRPNDGWRMKRESETPEAREEEKTKRVSVRL